MSRLVAIAAAAAALSAASCTSVEMATVGSSDYAAEGTAVAVVQTTALGLTVLFHSVDLVQADLDKVTNQLLVSEAKAMGGMRVELKEAWTTPRHGIFALFGFPFPPFNLVGVTYATATGIAVK